ncbi:MAG: hypothetical protein COW03_13840 [Cytophagales bacterium CG12_big_fil_rev_8_21_14_0_65_40_12]|nr:MAG: hypothetical protein COW03_13840 [Cytophagales bacterium CG12_big_fil_rev_8_21_14_0_65_40_12]PIW04206.1 MAG: hypothetical protein COW40_10765 [Cytophagales bacterium CG17_big_fil_post_rev_8_21_14_2_50_40_13]
MTLRILFILLSFISIYKASAYQTDNDSVHFVHNLTINQGALISYQNKAPFWLTNNNSGRFEDTGASNAFTNVHFVKHGDQTKPIDYFYGGELNLLASDKVTLSTIQGYAGLQFKFLNLRIGKKEEFFGLSDSTLTIGNLTYGNNARPIPKIVLTTNDWINAPILPRLFSFKAYLAHGWFEKNRFQSSALLHEKYAYLRAKIYKGKVEFIFGLHHNAQWGGINASDNSSQPTGLKNFKRIFLGGSGGGDALQTDQQNALGNHLGSYDLSTSLQFRTFKVINYWQFLWEDSSGLNPLNWRDGLFGISVILENKKALISRVNLEIIRTNDQDALKTGKDGNPFIEPDSFFNNGVYRSGWTYQNRGIGNPVFLLLNPGSTSGNSIKNMVNGVNIGLSGKRGSIQYRLNYRWFKNQGTYTERIEPSIKHNAFIGQLILNRNRNIINLKGALEWGNYLGGNFGLQLSYGYRLGLN